MIFVSIIYGVVRIRFYFKSTEIILNFLIGRGPGLLETFSSFFT